MLELYKYVISNCMYISIIIIGALTSILICKNSSSAKFKYSILRITLLFCVVPLNMLLGELISFTNILEFNYIQTHDSNYKLQKINFDDNNFIQSYTRINNINSSGSDDNLVNITGLTNNISSKDSVIEAKLIENGLYILWVLGVVVNVLWFAYCYIYYKKHLKKSINVYNKDLVELLETSKQALNINKSIDLYYNKDFTTPILCGISKPIIVIPQKLADYQQTESNNNKIQSILTHELVHYRRKDLYIKALLLVVQILNWFNPCLYLLNKYINKYLEFSCDEEVVMRLDKEQRKIYGLSIIEHATLGNNKNNYIVASLSAKAKKEAVKERIDNMIKFNNKKVSKSVVGLVCVTMCGAITIPAIAYSNNNSNGDSPDSIIENIKIESDIIEPVEERIVDIAVLDDDIVYKDNMIFDKSDYIKNKEAEEYSKYLIESLYGVNFDSVQPIFSSRDSSEFYMRNDGLTAIFDDTQENDTLIICDIDTETFQVYSIDSLVKGNKMPVDINLITQETKDYLTSEAINILNKIGLSVSDKEIDYYITGNNSESISVGFKDELGNYEFVEFSSPEYKFVGYNYYENNSVALESVLNVLNFNNNSVVMTEGTAEFSANSGGRGTVNYDYNKDDDNYEAKAYFKNLGTSEVNIKTYTASNQEVHSVILEVGQSINCVFNEENLENFADGIGGFHVESKDGADAKVYYKYSVLDSEITGEL